MSLLWLVDAGPGLPKVLPGADRATIRTGREALSERGWIERAVKTEIDGARGAAAV